MHDFKDKRQKTLEGCFTFLAFLSIINYQQSFALFSVLCIFTIE